MKSLLGFLRGALSLTIYALNTIFWCSLLFVLAGVKALLPLTKWRKWFTRRLHSVAENWIWVNNLNQSMLARTRWNIQGMESLNPSGWYLVLANHQSWVDILVLQRIFNRKIPFQKFFIKKGLFWFPVLGQAWWALDFPFIKRYSASKLKKNPHLKGKNLETTRKSCELVKRLPTSIMNFAEGTRFTQAKHAWQDSPYANLLKPKAGGIASVFQMMGTWLDGVLDVTIVYPDNVRSFWDFACGNIREIKVFVRQLAISPELLGDYAGDANFRQNIQDWLNNVWAEKDRLIEHISQETRPEPLAPGME